MKLSREQCGSFEHLLPVQRGNVKLEKGILIVAVNDCTLRALPKCYGRRHTVYTRMNRWAKRVRWTPHRDRAPLRTLKRFSGVFTHSVKAGLMFGALVTMALIAAMICS